MTIKQTLSALAAKIENPASAVMAGVKADAPKTPAPQGLAKIGAVAAEPAKDEDPLAIPTFLRRDPNEKKVPGPRGAIKKTTETAPAAPPIVPPKLPKLVWKNGKVVTRHALYEGLYVQGPTGSTFQIFVADAGGKKMIAESKDPAIAKMKAAEYEATLIAKAAPKFTPPKASNPTAAKQESAVRTTTKAKGRSKAAPKTKTSKRATGGKKKAARSSARKPVAAKRGPSKSELVETMLKAKGGASREELSKATGWPHVNLKTAAERAKMKLVEKDGRFSLV